MDKTIESRGIIKAFRAIGCEWMEAGKAFNYGTCGIKFKIGSDGLMWRMDSVGWVPYTDGQLICDMLNHPEEMKPVKVWSKETVMDARAAIRCRFTQVLVDGEGYVYLKNEHHDLGSEWSVPADGCAYFIGVPMDSNWHDLSEIVGGA